MSTSERPPAPRPARTAGGWVAGARAWLAASPIARTEPARARRALRVLVVDDDPGARLLCSFTLECEGAIVHEAADGRRGLEQAIALRPDLIVTDVMMPELDGFAFADALRRDGRTAGIPVVFLSGEGDPDHIARARRLGALAFLKKPLEISTVAPLLASAVGGFQASDAFDLARSARRH